MTESVDRELDAILKLIELTQDGSIEWTSLPPVGDLIDSSNLKYSNIMGCNYGGKHLRIYTQKRFIEKPNGGLAALTVGSLLGNTYPYWSEKDILEITNERGQSLWRFGYKPAIKDLVNAAKYQVSGIQEFLNDILKK